MRPNTDLRSVPERIGATGETRTFSFKVLERYLAVGEEARAYENTPDVMVFSPFRDGQVAQYGGARVPVSES